MRLKSLLLFIFLTQIFCTTVFGQQSSETVAAGVEKKDSIQSLRAGGVMPFSSKEDLTAEFSPSSTRDVNPVLGDKMDSRKSIFYSNAQMYVAKNTANDASMFVQGTVKFDNDAEVLQVGETALTGDFVSLKDDSRGAVKPLFVTTSDDNDKNKKGVVKFVGQWNKQHVVRESIDGTIIPNTLDNAKKVGTDSKYVISFPNIKVAKESVNKMSDIPADKVISGVGTVKYDVQKMGLLSVNSNVAMSIENLDITDGNRFSVDVLSDGMEKKALGQATITSAEYYKLNPAYVNIKKMVKLKADGTLDPSATVKPGHSEVNMRLYDYDPAKANAQEDDLVKATNTAIVKLAGGSNTNAAFLRGFTSPFDKLRADYMFYHVLTRPSATSITSWNGPISDPRTLIETGAGHFMAMDASREYFKEIEDKWHGESEKRARGGYNLSRVVQRVKDGSEATKIFSLYTFDNDVADAKREYEAQRFNVENVTFKILGGGLTFLGNPFMTPINMSGLLAAHDGTNYDTTVAYDSPKAKEPFTPRFHDANVQVVHQLNKTALDDANRDGKLLLRSKYWMVHSALVANTVTGGIPTYAYNVKYDNISRVTQAQTVPDDVFDHIIEPMQMFLVQSATKGDFVFTQEMKTFVGEPFKPQFHDVFPTVPETRGFSSAATESNERDLPTDWLVVEAIASGDNGKNSVDRTAVRFFDQASLSYEDERDEKKNFSERKEEESSKARKTGGIAVEAGEVGAPSNVVYTTATGGEKLLSNGIGYETTEVPLYYISTEKVQNVTLAITGIEGFDRVGGVSLVDRFVNSDGTEYIKPLSEYDNTYDFTTIPGRETMDVNRFFLRFADNDNGEGPSLTDDPITCYYSGSTLHIGGLNEKDLGSKVQIFDLQGRMMGNTVINNYPSMEYAKPLGQGTFIVNIAGERNYKTKFVNLQNY